jgi:hypothetical protein
LGIGDNNIDLLVRGSEEHQRSIPTADSEQPGMGKAVGSVVGGAVGVASGLTIGTMAAAAALVPGVGPVLAAGALGAAVLGLAGAVGGGALGENADRALMDGIPKDEVFVYEDALRQGRSLVLAIARDETERDEARRILEKAGAETIDAARSAWWIGLRDAEREHYEARGRDFATEEDIYRRGFETALRPEFRGKTWEQALYVITERDKSWSSETFREGYERGQRYYRLLLDQEPAKSRLAG